MLAGANEEMQMIGQNHIATYSDTEFRLGTSDKIDKGIVKAGLRENGPASISATSHEVQWISNIEQG